MSVVKIARKPAFPLFAATLSEIKDEKLRDALARLGAAIKQS